MKIRTTTPNEVVKPIHPSRMPVILDIADCDTWLTGSPDEAAGLLRPFAADRMRIAVEGEKANSSLKLQRSVEITPHCGQSIHANSTNDFIYAREHASLCSPWQKQP